jgi:hypothetical protein
MRQTDQVLINAYTSLGMAVDRIAVFAELRNAFIDRLPAEMRAEQDDDAILWRLVQPRKSRKLSTFPSEN